MSDIHDDGIAIVGMGKSPHQHPIPIYSSPHILTAPSMPPPRRRARPPILLGLADEPEAHSGSLPREPLQP